MPSAALHGGRFGGRLLEDVGFGPDSQNIGVRHGQSACPKRNVGRGEDRVCSGSDLDIALFDSGP